LLEQQDQQTKTEIEKMAERQQNELSAAKENYRQEKRRKKAKLVAERDAEIAAKLLAQNRGHNDLVVSLTVQLEEAKQGIADRERDIARLTKDDANYLSQLQALKEDEKRLDATSEEVMKQFMKQTKQQGDLKNKLKSQLEAKKQRNKELEDLAKQHEIDMQQLRDKQAKERVAEAANIKYDGSELELVYKEQLRKLHEQLEKMQRDEEAVQASLQSNKKARDQRSKLESERNISQLKRQVELLEKARAELNNADKESGDYFVALLKYQARNAELENATKQEIELRDAKLKRLLDKHFNEMDDLQKQLEEYQRLFQEAKHSSDRTEAQRLALDRVKTDAIELKEQFKKLTIEFEKLKKENKRLRTEGPSPFGDKEMYKECAKTKMAAKYHSESWFKHLF